MLLQIGNFWIDSVLISLQNEFWGSPGPVVASLFFHPKEIPFPVKIYTFGQERTQCGHSSSLSHSQMSKEKKKEKEKEKTGLACVAHSNTAHVSTRTLTIF